MPSPEKPKATETKRKTKKRSNKNPELSPEELARRFLDMLGRDIKLPADDLIFGNIRSARSKNLLTPIPEGPIGWSIPSRHGSKTSQPFLIYEDPQGLEHPTTPPSRNSSTSPTANEDKENLSQEVTGRELEAFNGGPPESQRDGDLNEGSDNASDGTTERSSEIETRAASPEEPLQIPGIAFLFSAGPAPVQLPQYNPSIAPRVAEIYAGGSPRLLLPVRRPRRRPRPRASDFF